MQASYNFHERKQESKETTSKQDNVGAITTIPNHFSEGGGGGGYNYLTAMLHVILLCAKAPPVRNQGPGRDLSRHRSAAGIPRWPAAGRRLSGFRTQGLGFRL